MLLLTLFGRPQLSGGEGTFTEVTLNGLPLALLSTLAVAGAQGMPRDRLLALLWPEVEEAKAAHRLTQARYALRKSLGITPILGVLHLNLDTSVLSTDVEDFRSAVARQDMARAVGLAERPFLDGFYFRESGEFERWLDEQRRDFAVRVDVALEKLAAAAEEANEAIEAAAWLERIVRRDPTNEGAAQRAITNLEAGGNHAQARRLAIWVNRMLRDEYDVAPEPPLRRALDRLLGSSRGEQTSVVPTIAVLPLRNVSPEGENDFFSDGMTDEIMGALSRIQGLRVASRTSSYVFKGKDVDIRQIASRLGATLLVEGSVRKVGNRIRLSAQLTSAEDGCQLWSDTFDRKLEDVFDLQSELAAAIVTALPLNVGSRVQRPDSKPQTTDPETYTLYLKGRYWTYRRSIEGLQLATEYFEQAIERDPTYALSWTGLADCQTMLGFSEFGNLPPLQTMPRAKAAVARSLELSPDLTEAHLASGVLSLVYDWNWTEAEASLHKALKIQPLHPMAETWYGMLLSALGRHDEAVGRIRRAAQLDPLAVTIHLSVGRALYFARRYDEALNTIRAATELDARHPNVHIWLCRTLLVSGRYEEALAAVEPLRNISALSGYVDCLRVTARTALGEKRIPPLDLALPYAFMIGGAGRIDDGITSLEACLEKRLAHMPWMGVEPLCDPMRPHPRFKKIWRAMRLPGCASSDVRNTGAAKARRPP